MLAGSRGNVSGHVAHGHMAEHLWQAGMYMVFDTGCKLLDATPSSLQSALPCAFSHTSAGSHSTHQLAHGVGLQPCHLLLLPHGQGLREGVHARGTASVRGEEPGTRRGSSEGAEGVHAGELGCVEEGSQESVKRAGAAFSRASKCIW